MRRHAKAATAGSTKRTKSLSFSAAVLAGLIALVLAPPASAVAPAVSSTGVSAVTSKSALLEASINPEGEATTFHFEYGPGDCGSTACTTVPVPDGNVGSGSSPVTVTTEITGLVPDTTYHFRAVATNASGPSASGDRTFTTYPAQAANTDCPNQAFRFGASATLPDCRAYEMVSPVDKNGGDISTLSTSEGFRTAFLKSSLDGGKFTYSSYRAFGDALAGPYSIQYLATRGASGWSTHGISPPRKTGLCQGLCGADKAFQDFTDDLSTAWLYDESKTPLTSDALQESVNLYRRNNLDDSYRPLTINELVTPPQISPIPNLDKVEMQGHSADAAHAFFAANVRLTPNATPTGNFQVYDFYGGQLHLVSILPDGTASPEANIVGTGTAAAIGMEAIHARQSLDNAISDTGDRVYWSAGTFFSGVRPIYLRINPAEPESAHILGTATGTGDVTAGSAEVSGLTTASGSFQVGQSVSGQGIPSNATITAVTSTSLTLSANATITQSAVKLSATSSCTEPDRACTTSVATGQYWTATPDGSQMLYSVGGSLRVYDADTGSSTPIAGELIGGVAGTSDDVSYVYFASEEVLAPGAAAGQPNLYLAHNGTMTFIATLSALDIGGVIGEYNMLRGLPLSHAARVSPDGRTLAFQSNQSLTGYDNSAANNGEPAVEVYVYSADTGELLCVSCNPSGVRPTVQPLQQPFRGRGGSDNLPYNDNGGPARVWTAAWLTTAGSSLNIPRPLSDDGNRLFFNSFDALLPQDTNGVQDVYQWERQGSGDCHRANGCLSLISTGENPVRSEFVDATPDGSDVFFETSANILPQDTGLIDIYDAREGGGFPPLSGPPSPCVGDSCQNVPAPPNDPTPASAGFRGAGNANARGRCNQSGKRAAQLRHRAAQLRRRAATSRGAQENSLRQKAAQLTRKARGLGKKATRCRRSRAGARR